MNTQNVNEVILGVDTHLDVHVVNTNEVCPHFTKPRLSGF